MNKEKGNREDRREEERKGEWETKRKGRRKKTSRGNQATELYR